MTPLLISAAVLAVLFATAWFIAIRISNYSIVDAIWALSFVPIVALYAMTGEGWIYRRIAVAMVIGLWGLRLGIHLARRIASHHPHEDRRYSILRARWPKKIAFLWFFLAQGLLVWLLTLPFYLIALSRDTAFHWLEVVGLLIWCVGLGGEAVADYQLSRFAASKDSNGVCQIGLWRYSRHPNYFFQSLLWWGLFLAAVRLPYGGWAFLAPLAMLYTLLKVTGIPLTERLSVEKRGEAYRRYQASTSAFLPLPKRTQ